MNAGSFADRKDVMENQVSRLARLIHVLVEPRPDLRHEDGSPNASAIARAGIRRGFTLSQPTVSRILHGQITNPDSTTVRALAAVFGVPEAEIRGEPAVADELTPLQRSIAERWAKLPQSVQDYLAQQIDQVLEFSEDSPAAAKRVFKVRHKSR